MTATLTPVLSDERLAAIRNRSKTATVGPWRWHGNVDYHHMQLVTTHSGMINVMGFRRWGMQGAQATFNTDMWMKPAKDFVVKEREYRGDIDHIDHPDAEFIVHSRQDIDDLLTEVDRLRAIIGEQ